MLSSRARVSGWVGTDAETDRVDTKKFKSALAQTLDAIEASASWLERDQKDVEEVSRAGGLVLTLRSGSRRRSTCKQTSDFEMHPNSVVLRDRQCCCFCRSSAMWSGQAKLKD